MHLLTKREKVQHRSVYTLTLLRKGIEYQDDGYNQVNHTSLHMIVSHTTEHINV